MAVHYLIDFENVREDGLAAVRTAQAGDTVYLIYTANAAKINLDAMAGMHAGLKIIKVAAGKQSLDMHLVSIMGFLLNAFGQDDSYVVVSNDNGFDGVVNFWKSEGYHTSCLKTAEPVREEARTQSSQSRSGGRGKRSGQNNRSRTVQNHAIMPETETVSERTPDKQPEAEAPKEESGNEVMLPETVNTTPENRMPGEEQKASQEEAEAVETAKEEASAEAPAAVLIRGEEQSVTVNKPSNRGKHGRSNGKNRITSDNAKSGSGEEGQETVSPAPAKKDQPLQAEARTALNNKLQGLLAEGGADGTVAGQVASVVLKNIGSKNYKQVIYRTITHKFGQKKGLEYYNLIKALI